MMDAIKTLTIMGAQSHADTILNFKRYGVHRISAEGSSNSHGKSVIMKMMDVLSGEYLDLESRRAIIRDDADFALVSLESYNGYRLSAVITEEKANCFYMLHYKGEAIKKSLSDDYKELIKVLNFHKVDDLDYSLNRYKTKTTLPFTHFTGSQNEKILVSASEIEGYRKKLSVLDENLAIIEQDLNLNKARISGTESALNDIKYKYTKDDIVNFNIFDTYVKNYDYTKDLFLSIKDVTDTHTKIKELQDNKPTDVSFLSNVLGYMKNLSEATQFLNKAKNVKLEIEELNKQAKPVCDLSTVLTLLHRIGDTKSLLDNSLYMKNLIKSQQRSKPIISIIVLNNLDSLSKSIKDRLSVQYEINVRKKDKPIIQLDILRHLDSLTESLQSAKSILSVLTDKQVKHTPLDLTVLNNLEQYLLANNELCKIKKEIEEERKIEPKINLVPYRHICTLSVRVKSALDSSRSLNTARDRSKIMLDDLRVLTEQLGYCPTCGGQLDLERILEHEH